MLRIDEVAFVAPNAGRSRCVHDRRVGENVQELTKEMILRSAPRAGATAQMKFEGVSHDGDSSVAVPRANQPPNLGEVEVTEIGGAGQDGSELVWGEHRAEIADLVCNCGRWNACDLDDWWCVTTAGTMVDDSASTSRAALPGRRHMNPRVLRTFPMPTVLSGCLMGHVGVRTTGAHSGEEFARPRRWAAEHVHPGRDSVETPIVDPPRDARRCDALITQLVEGDDAVGLRRDAKDASIKVGGARERRGHGSIVTKRVSRHLRASCQLRDAYVTNACRYSPIR